MKISLVQATPNPVEFIAKIASICYDSDPQDAMKLVKHLYRNGHHSVFEHVYFTFKIEGISRACSHQFVRHRQASFTQRSQRYCDEDGFAFVTPESIKEKKLEELYEDTMKSFSIFYELLKLKGIPNEDARFVLPNACTTEMYFSCNLRELIHICNERLCERAQWEIREMVQRMVSEVPKELHFMLVPKCKSGRIICNEKCDKKTGGNKNG